MEVEATVIITIAGQTLVITMDEAKELKAKLDLVVPIPPLPPFMQKPREGWEEKFQFNDINGRIEGQEVDNRG